MLRFVRRARLSRAAYVLVTFLLSAPAVAGKLADAGRATRTPSSTSSSSDSSSGGDGSSSHHHSDGAGAELAFLVLTSPWTLPYYALEPRDRGTPAYEDYPYSHGSNGLLRYSEPEPEQELDGAPVPDERVETVETEPASRKSLAAQVRAEGGYVLGGVYRGAIGARLMTPVRLELDFNVDGFAEPLQGGTVDRATFGNVHLGFRFAQSEAVQFRTGFGYEQYADERGIEPGIDFFYGLEAELGAHLILDLGGNLGSAGEAFVAQARATLGVMIGRFEIYGGYDHVSIGGVPLGGPALGVRAWL
jgi:hypothetical protein